MARRRTKSHLELREQFDAAERKKETDETDEEEEEEESDEDEEEEEGDEGEGGESEEGADDEEGGGDDDDEDGPKKKKKKKAAKPVKEVKPKAKRSRTAKVVRMKIVWAVFNNSNQRVAAYDYPKRKEAEEHAERLRGEKKATFFVQPVKEPIVEKEKKV